MPRLEQYLLTSHVFYICGIAVLYYVLFTVEWISKAALILFTFTLCSFALSADEYFKSINITSDFSHDDPYELRCGFLSKFVYLCHVSALFHSCAYDAHSKNKCESEE